MRRFLASFLATAAVLTAGAWYAAPGSARPAWDTSRVHVTHDVRPTPEVVNLRVGRHATYDRLVVDFQGKLPGYDVGYVKELRYDGSGDRVPLDGARFLQIRVTPAVAHDSHGHSVYEGPQLQRYQMPTLRGVAFLGDYEGTVSFGVALSHVDTFRVLEVSAPNRLVIDLHH